MWLVKFTDKSVGKRIVKIGQHLAKLDAKNIVSTFFPDTVYNFSLYHIVDHDVHNDTISKNKY